jgi:PKD repeat protein
MSIPLTSKAIQDEQGEAFDQYGRAGGFLGLQTITAPGRNTLLLYGYNSPPTDVLNISMVAMSEPQPGDGTQIWKITHNGVDSHPVHWHLYNVQVINRVGWDGFIRPPHATELGWKETLRVSPLEDTIVALRPVAPTLPFPEPLPDSVRPIDPAMPLGAQLPGFPGGLGWSDPAANPITVPNHLVNLGWEYVWHCHILAHEEMDMMHSQAVSVNQPGNTPTGLISGEVNNTATNTIAVYLAWQDNSNYETDWIILRSNITETNWTELKRVPSYTTPEFVANVWAMAIDNSIPANTPANYTYKVQAANIVGDDYVYPGSSGFPTIIRKSTESAINQTQANTPPVASFTLNPASGFAPLNVSFTDTSDGVVTGWLWDFGDGNYASDNGKQNPNHVYELNGTYTVRLTAMNTGGSNLSATSQTVTVSYAPPPAAPIIVDFTNSTTTTREGFAPHTVTFNVTATSDPAVWATWRWSFGDGTFSSVKNATHTYTVANNYTVSLTATNLGGTTVLTKVGYINVTNGAYKIGVFRGLGFWYFDMNNNGLWDGPVIDKTFNWGKQPGDMPITGDWNSDLITETGIFRPGGTWYLDMNNNGTWDGTPTDKTFSWGKQPGDMPITGDWNSDLITETGIFRPGGTWYLDMNNNGTWDSTPTDKTFSWGKQPGDIPITGDWNRDSVTETGIFRSGGTWYLDMNNNGTWDSTPTDKTFSWGKQPGDIPITGDWTADGITKTGIFRPGVGFYLDMNNNGIWDGAPTDTFMPWALQPGDKPVIGRW